MLRRSALARRWACDRCQRWRIHLSPLDVAYAGSMGSLMEGPMKSAAAQALKIDLHGRAQGSNALAQLIVGGSIRPDVFISDNARARAHYLARRQSRFRAAHRAYGDGDCL